MEIPSDRRGVLPRIEAPRDYVTADGRLRGWSVAIPGGRPLATPAVSGGRVFVGGGFGSYEFYAFDAATGRLDWVYQTRDDGPTAAIVVDEFVIFNTESCELEVLTVAGQSVWKKWLGDPLMSMPAAAGGRVFIAYPDSRGDRRQHYLASFDLKSGEENWKQPISGEVITAPVLAEERVYFSTLDGNLWCMNQADGALLWRDERGATSSPVVWRGECYFSRQQEMAGATGVKEGPDKFEWIASRSRAAAYREYAATRQKADYLHHEKRQTRSPRYAASARYDAHVGFAHLKGDAKIEQAQKNLGTAHVHGVWAFQGSKPFVHRARLCAAQGVAVRCLDPTTDHVHWAKELKERAPEAELLDIELTPPSTVNGKLFLGTLDGEVCCLSADEGETLWKADVTGPVVFQPAVSAGRVYVGTENGGLVCIETGDPRDDGWNMWGADACHNGCVE